MTLKDILQEAIEILKSKNAEVDYDNLFACARIRLHDLYGEWFENNTVIKDAHKEVVLYGIIAEWAFINGDFPIWKEYEAKYNAAIKGVL